MSLSMGEKETLLFVFSFVFFFFLLRRVASGDVVQGELGDCWFIGALSVVATRNDLLFPLFVSCHLEYGFFQVKLFKNGAWRVVTIDDFVPMKWGQIRFGKCSDPNELWVPLVESTTLFWFGMLFKLLSLSLSFICKRRLPS